MIIGYLNKWYYFILLKLSMLRVCLSAAKNAFKDVYKVLNKKKD